MKHIQSNDGIEKKGLTPNYLGVSFICIKNTV